MSIKNPVGVPAKKRRVYSLTAFYMLLMFCGLILIQTWAFVGMLEIRSRDQINIALSDRARIAVSFYLILTPLSPEERVNLVQRYNYVSFGLTVEDNTFIEQGTTRASGYLSARIDNLLGRLTYARGDSEQVFVPAIYANIPDDESSFWYNIASMFRVRRPGLEGRTWEGYAVVELPGGQWMQIAFNNIFFADNNVPRLAMEFVIQLLLQLALAFIALRIVTKSLRQLADFADHVDPDHPTAPLDKLPSSGPGEVMRASDAMRAMYNRLREYVDERVKMLASISHDLRNPIHRLRLQLANEPALKRPEAIEQSLEDLQNMTENILQLLKSGAVEEEEVRIAVDSLLTSIVSDYAEDDEYRDRVRLHLEAKVRARLKPQALRRCLENIIDNGLRYGDAVDVYLEERDADWRIRVVDQGPGIAPEYLEAVFQPFFRLEASRNSETGGAGLGLSIARDLARANNASIRLRNLPEGGLEVAISFDRS